MIELQEEYGQYKTKMMKRNLNKGDCETISVFANYIKNKAIAEISSNVQDLASLAINVTYEMDKGSKEFAWKCFPDEIIENLKQKNIDNKIYIPVADEDGNIEYLWKKYSIKEFSIEKVEDGIFS